MSKRIWTESRQIEAYDSTQNKRGNRGKSIQGNQRAIRAIGSRSNAIGINQGQSVAIRGNLGAIGDKLEVILNDKKDKLGKRLREEERKKCSF